jgi:hypothetical protein
MYLQTRVRSQPAGPTGGQGRGRPPARMAHPSRQPPSCTAGHLHAPCTPASGTSPLPPLKHYPFSCACRQEVETSCAWRRLLPCWCCIAGLSFAGLCTPFESARAPEFGVISCHESRMGLCYFTLKKTRVNHRNHTNSVTRKESPHDSIGAGMASPAPRWPAGLLSLLSRLLCLGGRDNVHRVTRAAKRPLGAGRNVARRGGVEAAGDRVVEAARVAGAGSERGR